MSRRKRILSGAKRIERVRVENEGDAEEVRRWVKDVCEELRLLWMASDTGPCTALDRGGRVSTCEHCKAWSEYYGDTQ